MTRPIRIQRSRAKGAHLTAPNGLPIVCVSRPSKWGNPFSNALGSATPAHKPALRAASVVRFRRALLAADGSLPFTIDQVRRDLSGKNLACWCPLDEPCHADVLLEVANKKR
ncbi:MAG TPA: DUF4326 domain-containing protein [Polyangiaceae bacterium]|jgi:hypothetical protein